jgi:hypothetical protein
MFFDFDPDFDFDLDLDFTRCNRHDGKAKGLTLLPLAFHGIVLSINHLTFTSNQMY